MLLTKIVTVLFALGLIDGMPSAGYRKTEQSDENPPNYGYQYDIKSDKGVGQGKTEIREGIHASGRYYVDGQNSSQSVEYVADKWGYHPYVEFQNTGPYSRTISHIAIDKEAMKMLNKKENKNQEVTQTEERRNEEEVGEQQSESVQIYIPDAGERSLQTPTEYLYVNQHPKVFYVPNDETDTKNTVLLQPVVYDEIVSVTPTFDYHHQQQEQNYETLSKHYERGYGTKTSDQTQKRMQNVKNLSRIKDLINEQDVLDINTAVSAKLEKENVSEHTTESTGATSEPSSNPTKNEQSLEDHPIIVGEDQTLTDDCETHVNNPTIIVTPRPISHTFLATVKLQPKTKAIHNNYVIDVQKSIPFYLGKIEYYDNLQAKEKNFTAVATQHIKLGDLLQQPIVEKPKPVATTTPRAVELVREEALQHLDNSKYVAQETKVVENPVHAENADNRAVAPKKPPVLQYVETPVPVENSGVQFSHPYSLTVQVPVAQAIYLPIETPKPYPIELTKLVIPTAYSFLTAPTLNQPNTAESSKVTKLLPTNKNAKRLRNQDNTYSNNLQTYGKIPCIDLRLFGVRKPYCPKINNNHYIGLVPPKVQAPPQYNATSNVAKKRTAREGMLDNIRWEYGFMPPLIPSLAIDEHGNPVDKHTK
ncbi:hypothetical protein FQR65_LT12114 [Abscondita terminalis]|nr:hypothetical protein FQR65_LT12114 [Abscondita terminalis]